MHVHIIIITITNILPHISISYIDTIDDMLLYKIKCDFFKWLILYVHVCMNVQYVAKLHCFMHFFVLHVRVPEIISNCRAILWAGNIFNKC